MRKGSSLRRDIQYRHHQPQTERVCGAGEAATMKGLECILSHMIRTNLAKFGMLYVTEGRSSAGA
jgi:hypothetical protein